jgi:hypothetical protein
MMEHPVLIRLFAAAAIALVSVYMFPNHPIIVALVLTAVLGEASWIAITGAKKASFPKTLIAGFLVGVPGSLIGNWLTTRLFGVGVIPIAGGVHIPQLGLQLNLVVATAVDFVIILVGAAIVVSALQAVTGRNFDARS